MAAWSAADTANREGKAIQVTVLEKMPRPGRKIMISGKGRCNFTNVKDWEDFSAHVASGANFIKSSFFAFNSRNTVDFFESHGMPAVIERGDRAYPASYRSSDVVDTLTGACQGAGVKIETECEVCTVTAKADKGFSIECADGRTYLAGKVIIATGGLSYPGTGSTGDGYRFATEAGHSIKPTFPSLTALVPKGYKDGPVQKGHIARETPLSELGSKFCGTSLKNIGAKLIIQGSTALELFGDIDFTDGGIEGPLGFQMSRKCIKSMLGGCRAEVELDLKTTVSAQELTERVKELWASVNADPRSVRLREKEKCRILLGKLMPWDLIPAFTASNPDILTVTHPERRKTIVKVWPDRIAAALKAWRFEIAGYVGYERAVVTAGGVDTSEFIAKTMESRKVPGLYLCGELLDIDCDTGGYNLQAAFSTGALAGRSAAISLL